MWNEEARLPLSPMHDNVLGEAPPPSLDLPVALKGENAELDSSLPPSRAGSAVPTEESRSPLTRLPENASSIGGGRPPSAELFYKAGLDAELGDRVLKDEPESRADSPSVESSLAVLEADAKAEQQAEAEPLEESAVVEVTVDKDAESAIHALLALQREPSPTTPRSRDSSPERFHSRPLSPHLVKHSGINKVGGGAEASRFFCKFPRCGKAYASTDAVRKHCRQRHLDWLRRLGHGCPALYCRWEE